MMSKEAKAHEQAPKSAVAAEKQHIGAKEACGRISTPARSLPVVLLLSS